MKVNEKMLQIRPKVFVMDSDEEERLWLEESDRLKSESLKESRLDDAVLCQAWGRLAVI